MHFDPVQLDTSTASFSYLTYPSTNDLHAILTDLESAGSQDEFSKGEEALISYLEQNSQQMLRAETSFSDIERIYSVFQMSMYQKRFAHIDAYLGMLSALVTKEKSIQKCQIQHLFNDFKTPPQVICSLFLAYTQVVRELLSKKTILSSSAFQREFCCFLDHEILAVRRQYKASKIDIDLLNTASEVYMKVQHLFKLYSGTL